MSIISRNGENIEFTRYSPQTIGKDHKPSNPIAATFSSVVNIQPATQRQREAILTDQGDREKDMILIFSDVELRAARKSSKTKADTLVYNGITYEVRKVENWRTSRIPHWRSFALMVQ